jgi:hypothetical protein
VGERAVDEHPDLADLGGGTDGRTHVIDPSSSSRRRP